MVHCTSFSLYLPVQGCIWFIALPFHYTFLFKAGLSMVHCTSFSLYLPVQGRGCLWFIALPFHYTFLFKAVYSSLRFLFIIPSCSRQGCLWFIALPFHYTFLFKAGLSMVHCTSFSLYLPVQGRVVYGSLHFLFIIPSCSRQGCLWFIALPFHYTFLFKAGLSMVHCTSFSLYLPVQGCIWFIALPFHYTFLFKAVYSSLRFLFIIPSCSRL